jgi:hypothetical protein
MLDALVDALDEDEREVRVEQADPGEQVRVGSLADFVLVFSVTEVFYSARRDQASATSVSADNVPS